MYTKDEYVDEYVDGLMETCTNGIIIVEYDQTRQDSSLRWVTVPAAFSLHLDEASGCISEKYGILTDIPISYLINVTCKCCKFQQT
jgi:hypothetical protein